MMNCIGSINKTFIDINTYISSSRSVYKGIYMYINGHLLHRTYSIFIIYSCWDVLLTDTYWTF